jgi:hypothetical protein
MMGLNPWKPTNFSRLAHLHCIKRKQRKRGGSRYGDE